MHGKHCQVGHVLLRRRLRPVWREQLRWSRPRHHLLYEQNDYRVHDTRGVLLPESQPEPDGAASALALASAARAASSVAVAAAARSTLAAAAAAAVAAAVAATVAAAIAAVPTLAASRCQPNLVHDWDHQSQPLLLRRRLRPMQRQRLRLARPRQVVLLRPHRRPLRLSRNGHVCESQCASRALERTSRRTTNA